MTRRIAQAAEYRAEAAGMTWRPLSEEEKATGPARNVELLMPDGTVKTGHYACGDGDGLMAPFDGWFEEVKSSQPWFREIQPRPLKFREITTPPPTEASDERAKRKREPAH